ncbi:MAG: hypothetical protein AB4352_08945 [Hormoscilla sp.]
MLCKGTAERRLSVMMRNCTAVPLQKAIGNQLARCDRTHIACLCPDRV